MTVVAAFYRRADAVARTLESLQAQTLTDFEAIVIDDGSADGTFAAMEPFAADPRFDLRRQANRGLTATLAAVCAEIATPYIAIVGAGDRCHPERLAAQVALLESDPRLVAVGCGIENVDEVTGQRWSVRPARMRMEGPSSESTGMSHGEVVYRTDAYHRSGGYRTAFDVGQFSDLMRRMTLLGDVGFVPDVLYVRYLRSDGVSADPHKLERRRLLAALSKTAFERRPELRSAGRGSLPSDGRVPPDAIDRHGVLAALYLPRSLPVARALVVSSLRATALGDAGEGRAVALRSLAVRATLRGAVALAVAVLGRVLRSAAYDRWVARVVDRQLPREDRIGRTGG